MLATLVHVLFFVAGFIGLLTIKQRRIRHIPTRRTHIPRRNAEGTLWLQRLVNACLDMLHAALAEQQAEEAAEAAEARCSDSVRSYPPGQVPSVSVATNATTRPFACVDGGGTTRTDDVDSVSSAEVVSDLPFLNALKAQLEEHISALLEDKGLASFVDFRIKDWGGKPPAIKAVCLSHGSGGGSSAASATGASASSSAAPASSSPGGLENMASMESLGAGGVVAAAKQRAVAGAPPGSPSGSRPQSQPPQKRSPVLGGSFSYSNSMHLPTSSTTGPERQSDVSGEGFVATGRSSINTLKSPTLRYRSRDNDPGPTAVAERAGHERGMAAAMTHSARLTGDRGSTHAPVADTSASAAGPSSAVLGIGGGATHSLAARHATDTTRSLSVLEAEVELEYSGNFSVSLNADIPIARGRYLQVYVSLSDVRVFAAHVRVRLSLEYEPATVESPHPQPYLSGTLWLLSDPMFDAAFRSTLTQYRIRDCFMLPMLVKFFFLRFVRTKLRPSSQPASSRPSAGHRRRAGAGASGNIGSATRGTASATGATNGGGGTTDRLEGMCDNAPCDTSNTSGLSFRVPLPADVVDGGEQWWSSIVRDSMSEKPMPFTSVYRAQ
ncbi:hypothetical protein JKF63_05932 [Porcisia hertigi]|uniref:Uncharacterized protein n=1 Tax=Porcisia hertigi TaxID=2761500 RepID=A0A836I726_9TRYP|nr:hypothetical protein JKF63_05932 [Porcisia hertigi]